MTVSKGTIISTFAASVEFMVVSRKPNIRGVRPGRRGKRGQILSGGVY